MKIPRCLLFGLMVVVSFLCACYALEKKGKGTSKVAANLASRSTVVAKVRLLSPGEGSKFRWAKLAVLEVLKNDSGNAIGTVLEVAYLSEPDPGFPSGEFVAYFEAYNSEKDDGTFEFLDGSVRIGTNQLRTKEK